MTKRPSSDCSDGPKVIISGSPWEGATSWLWKNCEGDQIWLTWKTKEGSHARASGQPFVRGKAEDRDSSRTSQKGPGLLTLCGTSNIQNYEVINRNTSRTELPGLSQQTFLLILFLGEVSDLVLFPTSSSEIWVQLYLYDLLIMFVLFLKTDTS